MTKSSNEEKRASSSFSILDCELTCPKCGLKESVIMPETGCQYSYTCSSCHTSNVVDQKHCCVYCQYGSIICPPKQLSGGDCCG